MPRNPTQKRNREELQNLLRDLFQFEAADLDFGIYRIMNQRRDQIEQFIDEDLLDAVNESLEDIADTERGELDDELEQKRTELEDDWNENIFHADGSLKDPYAGYEQNDIVEYQELREERKNVAVAEETEARIFSDLYRFFSRYYEDGDYHTKRRISGRDSKYYVPYNGEETHFHWANRDQYYVKTGEHFTDYRFDAGEYTVEFRLEEADIPQDNVKGDSRYFVLGRGDPVSTDSEEQRVTVHFQYRRITDNEADDYVAAYNEATGSSQKQFLQQIEKRCDALGGLILDGVEDQKIEQLLATSINDEKDAATRLKSHLVRYVSENSMDYFVHKDLETFLERELDFYLQNEVLGVEDLLSGDERDPPALVRARTVRDIAERIITFLAQIEDFQKRLFEKKKFVVQTDYMVTLDQVPDRLHDRILDNEAQLEQWREVYNTPEWDTTLTWHGEFDEEFLSNHPHVMVDTGLFEESFKLDLLSAFEDIEEATDGVLVNSENFQALNLLLEKYRNEVDCTYIDPPYNTGGRDFLYKDNYQHSSWIQMMADRLRTAEGLFSDDSSFFTSIDSREQVNLRRLMTDIFGESRMGPTIMWRRKKESANDSQGFSKKGEYLLPAFGSEDTTVHPLPLSEEYLGESYRDPTDEFPEGQWRPVPIATSSGHQSGGYVYEVTTPTGRTIDREWLYPEERFEELQDDGRIYWGQNNDAIPQRVMYAEESEGVPPDNMWYDLATNKEGKKEILNQFGESVYDTPKPPRLIERLLEISEGDESSTNLVMDFFAGSGTTAQTVIRRDTENQDRGYILVEMAQYFDTVLRPRIQKISFSSEWSEGVPQDRNGQTHFVKYHRLESYEDALNNITLSEPSGPQQRLTEEMDDYVEGYLLDFESRESASLLSEGTFEEPFDHELQIEGTGPSREPTAVDLVETFHYLVGADVRQYHYERHQNRRYVVTECEVGTDAGVETVLTAWRPTADLDRDAEAAWFDEAFESEIYDRVYVNGESQIARAEPLEITFRERMEESPNVE